MPSTGTPPVAITPQGVRDGDPAVLAALAGRRGPAVLAFAAEVCEPAYVTRAAADAFARFRAAVADPASADGVHPDALLLRCARRAALDLAPRGPDLGCGPAIGLLAARAERTLRPADATLLNRHLESCEHCSDLAGRLDAADRAYRDAGDEPLAPDQLAPMVAALAAAAPVRLPSPPTPTPGLLPKGAPVPPAQDASAAEEAPKPVAPDPAVLTSGSQAPETHDDDEQQTASAPESEAAEQHPEPPSPVPSETEAAEEQPEPASPAAIPADAEAAEEQPEQDPEPEREIATAPIRRTPYYELPPLPPRKRGRKARQAARGAIAAGGAAASLSRRAGEAARRRLERPAPSPADPPVSPDPPPAAEETAAAAPDTTTWQRIDEIEFPQSAGPAPEPEFVPTPLPEPEQQESAARAAARHYRRLRHSQQRKPSVTPATDGSPPRLLRPARERHHLPLSAHGPRDLALPAGLVVLAALVIMAVSGVFGGGSSTPPTGTQAHAAPVVAPVAESVTAISTADAVRLTGGHSSAGSGTP